MGKPGYRYHPIIKSLIYIAISERNSGQNYTEQSCRILKNMDVIRGQMLKEPLGDLKIKAVDEILIKRTKTYDGVAIELFYSRREVQKWVSEYIRRVGRKSGYDERHDTKSKNTKQL